MDSIKVNIAIVGGGMCGPLLARMLRSPANFPEGTSPGMIQISLFERSEKSRDQGCGFDLDDFSREICLKRGGVLDQFPDIARPDSNRMAAYLHGNEDSSPFFTLTQPRLTYKWWGPKLEVNRDLLRKVLIENLPDVNVKYGECVSSIRKVTSVEGNNRAELFSEDGSSLGEFDLVVDASGGSSRLRPFRVNESKSSRKENFTKVVYVHGVINDPESSIDLRHVNMLKEGTVVTCGPKGQLLSLQRYGAAKSDRRTAFYFPLDAETESELAEKIGVEMTGDLSSTKVEDTEKIKQFVLDKMGNDWDPMYRKTVQAIDSVILRPIYCHPEKPDFFPDDEAEDNANSATSRLPLICIGDSLHALPPWTGRGGNLALWDSNDMCDYVLESLEEAVKVTENIESPSVEQAKTKKDDVFSISKLRAVEQKLISRSSGVTRQAIETKEILSDFKKRVADKSSYGVLDVFNYNYKAYAFTWVFYFVLTTINGVERVMNLFTFARRSRS